MQGRRLLSSFSLIFALVAFAAFVPQAAFAAGNSAHHVSTPQTHLRPLTGDACYNNAGGTTNGKADCDGDDPQNSGCSVGAYTVTGGTISLFGRNESGQLVYKGEVDLRYSPHCGTNWARVIADTSVGGPTYIADSLDAIIGRQPDGVNPPSSWNYKTTATNTSTLWTPMVFAPTAAAKACGNLEAPWENDNGGIDQCSPWI